MKNYKFISFLLAMLCLGNCFAQNDSINKKSYIHPGLISLSSTLAPTFMLNHGEVNYYLMGFIEGRLDKHLSLRGDFHYMLPNDTTKFFNQNISVTFGLQYSFPFGNFELHTGLMPGVALSKSNFNRNKFELNPTVQINGGVRYYVWKYFHFFANFSYFHLKLNNLNKINGMADQFMIAVGLGFNFQVLKKYRN